MRALEDDASLFAAGIAILGLQQAAAFQSATWLAGYLFQDSGCILDGPKSRDLARQHRWLCRSGLDTDLCLRVAMTGLRIQSCHIDDRFGHDVKAATVRA
jgi:hypothetical protein